MTPRKGYQTGRGNDPKPIFRDLVIAVSGFLGGEPWTDVNIARWVSLRQGTFSQQMNASVTHLVCSEAEVKSGSPRVQEALRRGCKSCKVVTRDWLEDSMHADRRLPEVQFSPVKVVRKERKKELHKLQVMKGNLLAERAVNTNLYHDYQDGTYFKYTVTITRDDEVNGVFGERYILLLQESNAKPHLYWFFAKFYKSKTNTHAHIYRPSTIPGSFEREFRYFKSFFEKKTGVPWDERLVRTGPADKNLFRYTSPVSSPSFFHFVQGSWAMMQ
ncbi:hypothetical protein B0H66DRAFT_362840 [Apodospora peruviana]|uniref:BRCT domain-containing protein n=1 Tax=Apodospora peruviana TaxID=516989 RepID=A0AAE0HWD3_9PEZI|nr:hypothetical protein B0H66DRAFT_362840 [Apodospora peruviana]